MAKYFTPLAGAALLLASGAASAQLGNGGGTYAGIDKVNTNPPAIVAGYIETQLEVLNADSKLLAAFGLGDQALKAGAEAGALTPGATRAQIESALKVQADSGQALQDKLAAKAPLNGQAAVEFSSAIGDLSRGLINEAGMARDLVEVRKTLTTNGGAAASVIYLSKALPGAARDLGKTLQAAVDYARANNITLPPVASEALSQQ
ncbi:hypothetical protein [Duganella callida]|uniref:DUF4142 domain-containing protein n=1 Tax=Duganella callida TaxID=2561932 RepID=A0A4Y9SX16_9BURK|nr:hypothetical protein [Duganella callida]TFW30077.1 hypothetical protein E4L98_02700 [Duganella callida]